MRNNEFSLWPYVSRQKPGFVQQGGDMDGIRNISPGTQRAVDPVGRGHKGALSGRPRSGGTAIQEPPPKSGRGSMPRSVIKDAFTLDVTVRPDYSQVESDEPQVTVNQRFEVYFPEKRPFFMENAGYFKTPQQIFFSRRIIDPLAGARLTGKKGKWSIGSLFVADRGPGQAVPEDGPDEREDSALTRSFSVQRELKGNSNVALMATSTDFGSAHNRVLSADMQLQLLPNWILTGQAMSSDTRLPDGRRLNGPAYYLDWAHSGKHLIAETTYIDRSPSFVAGLGFINRVDIRDTQQTLGYQWRPEGSAIQSFGPLAAARINYDRLGRLQDWSVNPAFTIELPRMTQLTAGWWEGFELYANQGFRKHHSEIEASSDWTKWLAFSAAWSAGTAINYYPALGTQSIPRQFDRCERRFHAAPYRPHAHRRNLHLQRAQDHGGTSVFDNHIARSKVNYQFTRAASRPFHPRLQFGAAEPVADPVRQFQTHRRGCAVHLHAEPRHRLARGYTDLYDNWRLIPGFRRS